MPCTGLYARLSDMPSGYNASRAMLPQILVFMQDDFPLEACNVQQCAIQQPLDRYVAPCTVHHAPHSCSTQRMRRFAQHDLL
jgi:hypothetical protein